MKGARVVSNFEEIISTGGTRMVTFFLAGGRRMSSHFEISGNWSVNTLIVFLVAVAVIRRSFPPRQLSSPVERAIAGLNARLDPFCRPQFTTAKVWLLIKIHNEATTALSDPEAATIYKLRSVFEHDNKPKPQLRELVQRVGLSSRPIRLCPLHYVYCTMHYVHCTMHIALCTLHYTYCHIIILHKYNYLSDIHPQLWGQMKIYI